GDRCGILIEAGPRADGHGLPWTLITIGPDGAKATYKNWFAVPKHAEAIARLEWQRRKEALAASKSRTKTIDDEDDTRTLRTCLPGETIAEIEALKMPEEMETYDTSGAERKWTDVRPIADPDARITSRAETILQLVASLDVPSILGLLWANFDDKRRVLAWHWVDVAPRPKPDSEPRGGD
ncbi:MAG TPA: hypothetical protein VG271_17035, partial [Beijerinckiaceae bacterium]|nr:hypothetical protein [Beijerinckiaceae bacterium]